MPRTIILLDDGWTFSLDGQRFSPVSIPHDWCIERPVDEHAPLGLVQAGRCNDSMWIGANGQRRMGIRRDGDGRLF
ncbi:MAG: hypothetical protein ACI4MM_01455 [Candidatus Ventricola sp.]